MQDIRASRLPRRRRPTRVHPYRILVASDGGPGSLGALRIAVLLGRRTSAAVHAMIVATPFPHRIPTVVNVAPPALIDDQARREVLERLRGQLLEVRGSHGWAMRAAVGFAPDTIVDAAERWPASLVVVGLGRHGFLERLIRSDTAVSIARRSAVPMLAVPPGAQALPLHAIAAIDFSEASIRAAILAGTLLGPNGQLTLLHASTIIADEAEPGTEASGYSLGVREQLLAVEDRVRRACRRRVSSILVRGTVTEELEGLAARHECDLIALGGSDVPFVERLLTGSVRTAVMHTVDCAVLVVPAQTQISSAHGGSPAP